MSGKKKVEIQNAEATGGSTEGAEGWESLAEESSEGSLSPNLELEEAMREAAAAVDERIEANKEEAPPADASATDDSPRDQTSEADVAEAEGVLAELSLTQDRLLRLQADFENFRRRALKERTEIHQYGHQNLVKDLLSTVDNLDRAIDHAKKADSGDQAVLRQGVELVKKDLLTALAKNGVVEIDAMGKPFDPALHEAMTQLPNASVAPNTVVEVLQKGYLLRDRLLRPSRVAVARAPEKAEVETETGEISD
jgi:molecular chaperone GrpE